MRDLAYDLVTNAVSIRYDDLPKDVVQVTKKFLLDTMGNIVAGSSAPNLDSVLDLIREFGGKEESTILVFGDKVPSTSAAFVNSVMAFIRALDATHEEAGLHPFSPVIPSALAIAERKGDVAGKDLIAAIAVGVDLSCRLGLAVSGPLTLSWGLSPMVGCFGATVAVGRILGLNETELHHAIGIAYSQCAGNWQCVADRGLVTRLQPAFASRAGIMSSLLAQRGITGAKDVFEGKHGFFPLYFRGEYDRERVVRGLGKVFEGSNVSLKLYPCCQFNFGDIDATLDLVEENKIRPDDVAEVVAHVTQAAYDDAGKPFKIGESPQVDAQFSIPYTVAVAIVKRDVFLNDFSPNTIRANAEVLELAKKVRVVADQEPIGKGFVPCVVEIKTKAGKVYSQRVEIVRGDPRKPVSIEGAAQKFRKCAAFSAKPISDKKIERIINAINNLEAIQNVSEVIQLAA